MKQLLEQCAEWLSKHSDDKEAQELSQKIRNKLRTEEGLFSVSVVSRDDLLSQGYDGDAVDDRTMERIASSMGKAHTGIPDQSYSFSLEPIHGWSIHT